MSTQEQISSRNWWATYVRRVLGHTLRKSKDFAVLNLNILLRPSWTGANVILDDGPAGLLRAGRYYLKAFALAFSILLIADQFRLVEGRSEWRDLVLTIAEFFVAVPIIYAFCLALPDRIPFYRVVQAALYADGVFILVDRVVAIPAAYLNLTLTIPAANRELDVLGTEYERCLADNSFLYWLLRGDTRFYLYSDLWKPQDWINWLFENYSYLVAFPLVFIFALMLRPTRKISFALICLVTMIVFVAVGEARIFVVRQTGNLLAMRDFKCTFGHIDQVTKKYAPDLIARQLAYKINNSGLKNSYAYLSSFALQGTSIVLPLKLPQGVDHWRIIAQLPPLARQMYCSNREVYWVAVRRINYNLLFVMYDSDGTLLHQQQFAPKDCPRWPGSR